MGGIFDLVGVFNDTGQAAYTPPRDLGKEIGSILNQAGPLYSSYSEFAPKYTAAGVNATRTGLFGDSATPGLLQTYRETWPTLADATKATRTANYNDISSLGPGMVQAIRAANPAQAAAYDQLLTGAAQDYAAGDRLTPDQTYNIVNPVRADWARRGLGGSAPAQLDESLQLFAGGNQLAQQRRSNLAGAVNQGNALYSLPALNWLGAAAAPDTTLMGATPSYSAGGNVFSQLGGYGGSLYGGNYGGALQRDLYNANNERQMWLGTGSQMTNDFSALAGGFSSGMFCWSAREIFGPWDGRWLEFRNWMVVKAPEKLRRWYAARGSKWAQRLKTASPAARAAVERWMKRRICYG